MVIAIPIGKCRLVPSGGFSQSEIGKRQSFVTEARRLVSYQSGG